MVGLIAIAGSGSHVLGLKRDGTVVAWGNNHLGLATVPAGPSGLAIKFWNSRNPVPAGLTNVSAIAASEYLNLALRSNGTVVAWGLKSDGQTNVPVGLSNVVAIAAGGRFGAAITTGPVPASVYVAPRGRLEELEREADLIFKGCVVSSEAMTNASFPDWGKPHATRFRVVSVLKGKSENDAPIFWHNTSGPMLWSGPSPPSWHQFDVGQCYLVFAATLDKPASARKVRAAVADAIGSGKLANLVPVLAMLFSEPVGPTNPVPPLTLENLQNGGRLANLRVGDVHTSAGYALLGFDVSLTEGILQAHLDDEGFRAQFLCKLAEKDASPWLNELTEVLQKRRIRAREKADTSGVEPQENYYRSLMALSGTYFRCWNTIYEHLKGLPFAAFAAGKLDECLIELEYAGTSGSREPLMLHELYRMKGLNRRAAAYRKAHEPGLGVYGISQLFDKIDARYPRNGTIPDQ